MYEVVTNDFTYSILVNDVTRTMQTRDQVAAFSKSVMAHNVTLGLKTWSFTMLKMRPL